MRTDTKVGLVVALVVVVAVIIYFARPSAKTTDPTLPSPTAATETPSLQSPLALGTGPGPLISPSSPTPSNDPADDDRVPISRPGLLPRLETGDVPSPPPPEPTPYPTTEAPPTPPVDTSTPTPWTPPPPPPPPATRVDNLVDRPTTPPPPRPTLGGPRPTTYIVQPGDTFSSIARKHNTTVQAIQAANPNVEPTRLKVKQSINLPVANPPTPAIRTTSDRTTATTSNPTTYTIQPGDTFSSIAKKFNTSVIAIQNANPNIDPTLLKVNQVIKLPTARTATPARTVPTSSDNNRPRRVSP